MEDNDCPNAIAVAKTAITSVKNRRKWENTRMYRLLCVGTESGHQRDELVMLLGAANLDTCKWRANYAHCQVADFVEFSFDKSAALQKTGSVYGFQNQRFPFLGPNCSPAWEDSLGTRLGSRMARPPNRATTHSHNT